MILPLKERIDKLLTTGQYSDLFRLQFKQLVNEGYMEFDSIAREINYLEGSSSKITTKKECMFKQEPLKGLWHKHVFSASNIPSNAVNALSRNKKALHRIADKRGVTPQDIWNIVEKIGIATPYTGDWIIYQKSKQGNLYLTIALHDEQDNDQKIFDRVKKYLLKT